MALPSASRRASRDYNSPRCWNLEDARDVDLVQSCQRSRESCCISGRQTFAGRNFEGDAQFSKADAKQPAVFRRLACLALNSVHTQRSFNLRKMGCL